MNNIRKYFAELIFTNIENKILLEKNGLIDKILAVSISLLQAYSLFYGKVKAKKLSSLFEFKQILKPGKVMIVKNNLLSVRNLNTDKNQIEGVIYVISSGSVCMFISLDYDPGFDAIILKALYRNNLVVIANNSCGDIDKDFILENFEILNL